MEPALDAKDHPLTGTTCYHGTKVPSGAAPAAEKTWRCVWKLTKKKVFLLCVDHFVLITLRWNYILWVWTSDMRICHKSRNSSFSLQNGSACFKQTKLVLSRSAVSESKGVVKFPTGGQGDKPSPTLQFLHHEWYRRRTLLDSHSLKAFMSLHLDVLMTK